MHKKYFSGFVFISIALYALVFWGFDIRLPIPPEYHFLYPIIFLSLFIIHVILAFKMMVPFKILNGFQPLTILIFIFLNGFALYSLSSANRDNEIRRYFSKNEPELNRIAGHYFKMGDDHQLMELKEKMKIERLRYAEEMFQVRLYTCLGYGYGVLYADNIDIQAPSKLGGSPVTKWLKLKDHWYYYSIFD